MEKIHVTLTLYFEIRGAEMFDYDVGYADTNIGLKTLDLKTFDLQKYAQKQICGMANLLKVSPTNVRIISKKEYDENTEEA